MNSGTPPSLQSRNFKSFHSNYKRKCPYRAKDFRMHPSFPASYPFGKGQNKDFWLLSIKEVEGKLPASTITTSLNTFPLNPSLNTFFFAQLRSSQHSGTDSFLFSKREQKLLWEKKTKKPQPLKVQSTNDCMSSVASE